MCRMRRLQVRHVTLEGLRVVLTWGLPQSGEFYKVRNESLGIS